MFSSTNSKNKWGAFWNSNVEDSWLKLILYLTIGFFKFSLSKENKLSFFKKKTKNFTTQFLKFDNFDHNKYSFIHKSGKSPCYKLSIDKAFLHNLGKRRDCISIWPLLIRKILHLSDFLSFCSKQIVHSPFSVNDAGKAPTRNFLLNRLKTSLNNLTTNYSRNHFEMTWRFFKSAKFNAVRPFL